MQLPPAFINPTSEFSLMPFWFWNDDLSAAELIRQIDEMQSNGVDGFVIHPRVGLPREIGWMSDAMLDFMRIAIEEAARRGMKVILYDEGMYPSGSSCGQVVANDPKLAARCLAKFDLEIGAALTLPKDANIVADITRDGRRRVVVDRPVNAYIRGLHYIGEGPKEDEPPAGDILNPKTADMVIRLVYQKFFNAFTRHFGRTIIGVFTDEPNPLGKSRERGVLPGTTGILDDVKRILGRDISGELDLLFEDPKTNEAARKLRHDYLYAIRRRLDETWYAPLSDWCGKHNVALCGHPAHGDELAVQRFFQIPGQDLVWRFVEPGKPSGIEGAESTQGKCSSSAMIHHRRRRNSNEFCGAYGHETTFEEMKALADWCLVRGVNLLIPHAFYYSIRDPRKDERPPQLGPHTPAWNNTFKAFADHCRRLCWINTDSTHVCDIAILADPDHCPWEAARVLLEHQRDFNYIEPSLPDDAMIDGDGLRTCGMHYKVVIVEPSSPRPEWLSKLGARVISFDGSASPSTNLLAAIDQFSKPAVAFSRYTPALRYRSVVKDGIAYHLLFNESAESIENTIQLANDSIFAINTETAETARTNGSFKLQSFGTLLLAAPR